MLRALRFMDSMIQRDTMQKAAFLNDLTTFWHKFDDRVLRLKVCYTCLLDTVIAPLPDTRRPSPHAKLVCKAACRIRISIPNHTVSLYLSPVDCLSVAF